MLKISKKTSYGLQTVLYLGQHKQWLSVSSIAQAEKIPQSFLEQIIHHLRKANLVIAKRGAAGGYQLAKPLTQISLGDVIRILEEDVFLIECLQDQENCPHFQQCHAKKGWQKLQNSLLETMDNLNLAELIDLPNHTQNKIYLDYAATTPLDPQVEQAMRPFYSQDFGNPASIHWTGQKAAQAVNEARLSLAQAIGAKSSEIIFTSSATESNNLALKGVAFAQQKKKQADTSSAQRNKIIISAIEHDCVLNSAKWLKSQGYQLQLAPVDQYGVVNITKLKKLVDQKTLLVSIIHASNEIGTIQPIHEIGEICKQAGAAFHVDAAQSFTKIPINVNKDKIDLLTTSSHKIYGPKGIAFLYKRSGIKLEPLLHGGGQELGLRPSTMNVSAIVGFAEAAKLALANRSQESVQIAELRDQLQKKILTTVSHAYLNGHPKQRLYNNLNLRFDFIEGEALVLGLDLHGIAASTGSACSSPKLEPSHVLLALGLSHQQAHGSLRLSLGRFTTQQEVKRVAEILPQVVTNLRKISPYKQ